MNDSMNVAGNPINEPSSNVPRTRSKFDLSYHLFNTERFGEYNTPFVMDCVEGDKVFLRSGGSVQSYTLKSPFLQSISKKKDFYSVPMMAILPRNWDKFYTNPVIGDDVPDDCGTGVANFWRLVGQAASNLRQQCYKTLNGDYTAYALDTHKSTAMFRFLVWLEMFYSNGNLISSLGCHGAPYFAIKDKTTGAKKYTFDSFFDLICSKYISVVPWFAFTDGDGFIRRVVNDTATCGYMLNEYSCCSFHDFLQYMRDDLNTFISDVGTLSSGTMTSNFVGYFDNAATSDYSWYLFDVAGVSYNLSRVAAYQLVCAHFYSNDHVDYVYSAELYRSLMDNVCNLAKSGLPYTGASFTINGLSYLYDPLSAWWCNWMLVRVADALVGREFLYFIDASQSVSYPALRGYFSNLFSFRRSLRYVDYFTGSRTRPLAVGDVNVDVQTGTPNFVSVVDVSRNIQRQRFFNAVNRFGRKIEEYAKGLTGVSMAPDYHNPLYLAHTSDSVYGQEVENTGADQWTLGQSVTSRFSSNGNRYAFEFSIDRPSVVIGISYYDIPRVYAYSCERQLFHMNRFDMFNPFMQFIGDQAVYYRELGFGREANYVGNFGYQLRHMEYKQRYNQAAGGFIENLPGYAFTNTPDNARSNQYISSDYIRSLNGEIDRFYLSLTGFSLGSYFHFIVDNMNSCDASRNMAYAPSIL